MHMLCQVPETIRMRSPSPFSWPDVQPITGVIINGDRLKHNTANWWDWNPGKVGGRVPSATCRTHTSAG
jgi:hypothetical protein